jgi:hypothetical protein
MRRRERGAGGKDNGDTCEQAAFARRHAARIGVERIGPELIRVICGVVRAPRRSIRCARRRMAVRPGLPAMARRGNAARSAALAAARRGNAARCAALAAAPLGDRASARVARAAALVIRVVPPGVAAAGRSVRPARRAQGGASGSRGARALVTAVGRA